MDFFPPGRAAGDLGAELLPQSAGVAPFCLADGRMSWLGGVGLGSLHLHSSFSSFLPVALLFYLFLHYLEKRRREKYLLLCSLTAFPWHRVFLFAYMHAEESDSRTLDPLHLAGRIQLSQFRRCFRGLAGTSQGGDVTPKSRRRSRKTLTAAQARRRICRR